MENVMWFLEDENKNIIEQVLMPVNSEEQVINEFAARLRTNGVEGQFKIGYITTDGEKRISSESTIFGNPQNINNDESYKKEDIVDF